ncbi:MAG: L-lactate permease [Gemmataceae bacterium]
MWAASDSLWHQPLSPLGDSFIARVFSTFFAALPVLVLFYLLVPRRWLAPKAGAGGAITALLVSWMIFGMPLEMGVMSFVSGAAFGLLPVGWTIFNAMLLYNITVEMGQFDIVRRSVAGLSADARIQAVLIGFSFGAFLEGAAGGGTPVAICGAIMVGLGFTPFMAAVLCLIANTSPVAYGGLGTPLIVLGDVTGLPRETLSIMAGHQLPFLSVLVPLYMVKIMCSWKQTFEIWPALLVGGGSFAIFQFIFATIHAYIPSLVLYPMTDIGGGIFSLVIMAIFLQFWKPRSEMRLTPPPPPAATPSTPTPVVHTDPHLAEAAALIDVEKPVTPDQEPPLTAWNITVAWMPYVLMSIFLLLTGLVRQQEGHGPVHIIGPLQTNYLIPIPFLHERSVRDASLTEGEAKPEDAKFNFAWLTAPGTAVFFAAIVSMFMLNMNRSQIGRVFRRTFYQMRIPIPTIACMLGLSYITRYAGMDATLGVAFAETGLLYPFFAAMLGWLGVFLTGTDAGSNALFGSLQKITATQVYNTYPSVFEGSLTQHQAQVLICTANSTGGVMGKMIDAQSICVATAATHQLGKEADIFKAVFWHSIFLAAVIGAMTLIQAYLYPFTLMVPK